MKSYRILGIDPGYDRLGWAVGTVSDRKLSELSCGTIQTQKSDSYLVRFKKIHQEIVAILDTHKPSVLALETLVAARNAPTVVGVAQVRGMLIGECLQRGMSISEHAPSQVKVAVTGNGRASKLEVAKMITLLTKVKTQGLVDDTVDALAIALTGAVMG